MKSSVEENRCDSESVTNLESILGLRCLSIVLSYLEEYEGTSFLLCQNYYWTETILPLLRVPSRIPTYQAFQRRKDSKYRHRFALRNNAPVIRIPDASTRLERLNTRRWNMQQQQRRRRQREEQSRSQTTPMQEKNNLSTTALAEQEWNETVASQDNTQDDTTRQRQKSTTMTMPPLLRFYQYETTRRRYFLPGTTCLASYPRSGNTLLRSLLETVTGFVTSSDTRPDRNLSIALAEKPPYFVGEGLAPPSFRSNNNEQPSAFLPPQKNGRLLEAPPICKTHWPERIGCHSYDCDRVVLLVRNPFDATDSYWHMNLTNTHTEKVQPQVTKKHRKFYEALVRHEILQVWTSFLDYYWKECSKHKVPLLFVRYEDLVLNPRDELQRVLEFCCGKNNSNDNDWWKRRLEEATGNTSANSSSSNQERKTDNFGYKSSSSATESNSLDANRTRTDCQPKAGGHTTATPTATSSIPDANARPTTQSSAKSSHPSIGRSLRRGMLPQRLLKVTHEYDDLPPSKNDEGCGNWLERLGYHVYKQGFPNNLDQLPPVPRLEFNSNDEDCGKLTMNIQDVSLELRPRDSPYGRNMRQWRRHFTAKDTKPFPTL